MIVVIISDKFKVYCNRLQYLREHFIRFKFGNTSIHTLSLNQACMLDLIYAIVSGN